MLELKNEKIAVPVVLFAGILWSFGPLVVRYMEDPHMAPWQYIFGRGLTIFIILNLYLYFEEGINFYKNYKKIGRSGLIGGTGLGRQSVSWSGWYTPFYPSDRFTAAPIEAWGAYRGSTRASTLVAEQVSLRREYLHRCADRPSLQLLPS